MAGRPRSRRTSTPAEASPATPASCAAEVNVPLGTAYLAQRIGDKTTLDLPMAGALRPDETGAAMVALTVRPAPEAAR